MTITSYTCMRFGNCFPMWSKLSMLFKIKQILAILISIIWPYQWHPWAKLKNSQYGCNVYDHFMGINKPVCDGYHLNPNIILSRKIAISPQPTIQLTWDQSVNSILFLWSSRKKPDHSICLGLKSSRAHFSKSSFSVGKSRFLHNQASDWPVCKF